MHSEHDLVVLSGDVPADGLIAGDVGTVVGIYGNGDYEVEFTVADPAPRARRDPPRPGPPFARPGSACRRTTFVTLGVGRTRSSHC